MRRALFIMIGLAASLGVYLTASAQPAPKEVLGSLVAEEANFIKKTLAKEKLDKKSQKKVRLSALMIAQYAQRGIAMENTNSASLATLRDQALAVHKAVEEVGKIDPTGPMAEKLAKAKIAEAAKLAEKLTIDIAPNAAAKPKGPELVKFEEFETIMSQFSSVRLGGFGLEDYLETLTDLKANPDAAEAKKIFLFGKKLAMVSTLAETHVPAMLGEKKTIGAWKGFAKSMTEDSLELAKAAEGKNADAIIKAAGKVTLACKNCHDLFR